MTNTPFVAKVIFGSLFLVLPYLQGWIWVPALLTPHFYALVALLASVVVGVWRFKDYSHPYLQHYRIPVTGGPLKLMWLLVYATPIVVYLQAWNYGPYGATLSSNYDLLVLSLYCLHFLKRCLEVIFLKKYIRGCSMHTFLEISAFYSLGAVVTSYSCHKLAGEARFTFLDDTFRVKVGLAIYVAGELCSFLPHCLVASLPDAAAVRDTSSNRTFRVVGCPHYFSEFISWLGFAITSYQYGSYLAYIPMIAYLGARAHGTCCFENIPGSDASRIELEEQKRATDDARSRFIQKNREADELGEKVEALKAEVFCKSETLMNMKCDVIQVTQKYKLSQQEFVHMKYNTARLKLRIAIANCEAHIRERLPAIGSLLSWQTCQDDIKRKIETNRTRYDKYVASLHIAEEPDAVRFEDEPPLPPVDGAAILVRLQDYNDILLGGIAPPAGERTDNTAVGPNVSSKSLPTDKCAALKKRIGEIYPQLSENEVNQMYDNILLGDKAPTFFRLDHLDSGGADVLSGFIQNVFNNSEGFVAPPSLGPITIDSPAPVPVSTTAPLFHTMWHDISHVSLCSPITSSTSPLNNFSTSDNNLPQGGSTGASDNFLGRLLNNDMPLITQPEVVNNPPHFEISNMSPVQQSETRRPVRLHSLSENRTNKCDANSTLDNSRMSTNNHRNSDRTSRRGRGRRKTNSAPAIPVGSASQPGACGTTSTTETANGSAKLLKKRIKEVHPYLTNKDIIQYIRRVREENMHRVQVKSEFVIEEVSKLVAADFPAAVPENECIICREDLYNVFRALPVTRLLCGHDLHKSCVDEWFSTNTTCPMCRSRQLPTTSLDKDRNNVQSNAQESLFSSLVI